MFEEQFTLNSVTGSSSKLMIDKEEATAMVNIYSATGVSIARGAVSRGRDYATRNRGNKVVTADTITRVDMSLLEKHCGRCTMQRTNHGGQSGSLRDFTDCTKEIITSGARHVVGAWEERTMTNVHQLRGVGWTGVTALT